MTSVSRTGRSPTWTRRWPGCPHGRRRRRRWRAGLLARVAALEQSPDRCPLADEAADLGLDLRELLYGRLRRVYRILFTIDGSVVHIHCVRHAAQDRLKPGDV